MTKPYGMHPDAWEAWQKHNLPTERIRQTMTVPGHEVAASAGTHDRDGIAKDGTPQGVPYAVCVDISVKGLTAAQRKALISALADAGFAGFDRPQNWDGRGGGAAHSRDMGSGTDETDLPEPGPRLAERA
jgi:hypothetical protein